MRAIILVAGFFVAVVAAVAMVQYINQCLDLYAINPVMALGVAMARGPVEIVFFLLVFCIVYAGIWGLADEIEEKGE